MWYNQEGHIGYSREGSKLAKRDSTQLDRNVKDKDKWRTIYDEYNDEQITLSKEEVDLIQRVRQGRFPHVEVRTASHSSISLKTRPQKLAPISFKGIVADLLSCCIGRHMVPQLPPWTI